MPTVQCSAGALPALLARDVRRLDRRVKAAVAKAAVRGARAIEPHLPIAFGDLRRSLHVDATAAVEGRVRTVLDAPHAAAIEAGSRPHVVPIDALVRWVKLRGMQGLSRTGRIRSAKRRAWGATTAEASREVALAIRRIERASGREGVTPVDAPLQIARAIQAAIAQHGTKPHWPVRKSLPAIEDALQDEVRRAVTRD